MSLGTFVCIWEDDGDQFSVLHEHLNEIRAAYRNWVERRIDVLLEMTQANGDEYVTRASQLRELHGVHARGPEATHRTRQGGDGRVQREPYRVRATVGG